MIDISGPKVLIPTVLFAALVPGFVLPMKATLSLVGICAVSLSLLYFVIAKYIIKVTLTKADLIVPAVLFALLCPGFLLTLPKSNFQIAMGVHTLIFAIAFATLRTLFPQYY
jgi:hypothetical protein